MSELKWLVIGLIVFLFLLILIIITKLTILVDYHHYKDDDQLDVKIKAWYGLITYKIAVPLIKIDDNSPALVFKEKVQMGEQKEVEKTNKFTAKDFIQGLNDTKQLLTHIISLHKIIRTFLRKVTIKEIQWHSMIGVGDVAATGTLTGALWSVKGGLIGILSNYMRLKEMPIMSITPSFQRPITQTKFQCMIQFRLGYAMLAGIKLVKFWKGGRPNFQSDHLRFLSKDKTNSV
ncbi:DUF2953 domain-containing protein [Bacillus sp. T3]|uniref:DUF2953 domain-containing protein n=1 Tax=Bacillus sp. T3 TaxID=467262 RepID=UPI002980E886|nr:DUF2953 domain-containing protein [Bacillus sp. T3]